MAAKKPALLPPPGMPPIGPMKGVPAVNRKNANQPLSLTAARPPVAAAAPAPVAAQPPPPAAPAAPQPRLIQPAVPLLPANPAAAGVTLNGDQQLAQNQIASQYGIANQARQGVVDAKNAVRQQKSQLHDAKIMSRKTGDSSQLQSIQAALAQNRSDMKLAKRTAALAQTRAGKQEKYQPQAGTTYGPNQTAVTPTGQVLPMTTSQPGQVAQPLADFGDTVTQGHIQVMAQPNGRTPSDYQTTGEYQGASPNAFGLGQLGPITDSIGTQLSYVDPGKQNFSAGEVLNLQREADNLGQRDQAYRQQQGEDTLRQGQDNARSLYGQALNDANSIGQQAYGRIDQQQRNATSAMQSNLTGRGLGNSTITSALAGGIGRDANDARLGVDQQVAQQRMGLRTALADSERNTSGSIASAIMGQPVQDRAATSAADYAYMKPKTDYTPLIGAGIGAAAGLIPVVGPALGGIASGMGSSIFGSTNPQTGQRMAGIFG